jgi:hypothetical protein
MRRTIPSETRLAPIGEGGTLMSDTALLDMCDAAILARANDKRYGGNYLCVIGTLSFSMGAAQTKTFRELLTEAALARMSARIKGD